MLSPGTLQHGARPEMAPDLGYFCREFWSGIPAGTQKILFGLSRRLRFAPAPANIHRPSGAPNSFAEFANSIVRQGEAKSRFCGIGEVKLNSFNDALIVVANGHQIAAADLELVCLGVEI